MWSGWSVNRGLHSHTTLASLLKHNQSLLRPTCIVGSQEPLPFPSRRGRENTHPTQPTPFKNTTIIRKPCAAPTPTPSPANVCAAFGLVWFSFVTSVASVLPFFFSCPDSFIVIPSCCALFVYGNVRNVICDGMDRICTGRTLVKVLEGEGSEVCETAREKDEARQTTASRIFFFSILRTEQGINIDPAALQLARSISNPPDTSAFTTD